MSDKELLKLLKELNEIDFTFRSDRDEPILKILEELVNRSLKI
jgi:hypothetical protein